MLSKKALAASVSAGPKAYVEDVFSTWLYTGNNSTQTITNGIDLSGKGGLVWIKSRSNAVNHVLTDTQRGADKLLYSNTTNGEASGTWGVNSFSATGFGITGSDNLNNTNGFTYASWTFRKAEKFFDVVTYTGNGSNRTINHNLGSVPGTIIVKRTDTTGDWQVYHRSLANTEYLVLNTTAAKATGTTRWNSTTPTSTVFSLGTDATVNANGGTYVAYLFAHDAGGFGDAGSDSVVSCGSFTTDGSGNATVNLGWEPQWIITKRSSGTGNWEAFDSMRGMPVGTVNRAWLTVNSSAAEGLYTGGPQPNSAGFSIESYSSSSTFIYIAIRRGPMKTPTDATKVFSANTSSAATGTTITTGFPVDMQIARTTTIQDALWAMVLDRLRGVSSTDTAQQGPTLSTASTTAENTVAITNRDWRNTGFDVPNYLGSLASIYYSFCRAPGFFDVVAYTGTGSVRTVAHNLGVVPELMIVKKRSATDNWVVYAGDATDYLILNTTAATADLDTMWNDTAPTASVFSLGTNDDVNGNTATFIAYLFATLAGVSKVGSYTGTGTTLNVDCGFTNGARFVMIKRTDSTGDWYVWDTARGIVSGSDPFLRLNLTTSHTTGTDYIDPLSSGFQISSTAVAAINANGGSFIFLAIA
jgi:hypothetical protein